jgi:hypothetical protein
MVASRQAQSLGLAGGVVPLVRDGRSEAALWCSLLRSLVLFMKMDNSGSYLDSSPAFFNSSIFDLNPNLNEICFCLER